MIAIVGDLVIELIGCGKKPKHPCESPHRFVENVGNAVRAGLAERVELVCEDAIAWCKLISEQHLRCGITRGEKVFELIASVVPATGSVDVRAGRSAAVERVTGSIDIRVVAAALLPHEL